MRRLLLYLTVLVVLAMLINPMAFAAGGYDPDGWTGSHTHRYTGAQVRLDPTCEEDGYIGTRCTGCSSVRVDTVLAALEHQYVWGICGRCAAEDPSYVPGDLTGDGKATNDDVVLLLWSTLFPEDYPEADGLDLTGDGITSNDDVIALLWHTLFPEENPL